MTDETSVFDAEADTDLVWMNFDGGRPAQLPRAAAAAWKAKGWRPCDPPPDVDPALAEHQPAPTPEPPAAADQPADEPAAGDAGDPEEMTNDA